MATKNLGRVVGYSAYEIWLQQGNEGTIDDYLNSLKGETGDPGHTPVKGEDYFTDEDIQSLNIPTKTSELTNDSAYVTEEYVDNATSNIVTSYNDLEDKPFGEIITESIQIPEGTPASGSYQDYNTGGLLHGREYLVVYDGVEYRCTAIKPDSYHYTYVGNGNLAYDDIEATDYPFCINNDTDFDQPSYIINAENENATIKLVELYSETKQIDSKYIPYEYVTEDELDAKGYLTEIPTGYATEEYVDNATANIVTSYNDLTDKPFGEVIEETTVIPNGTSISEDYSDYYGLYDGLEYLITYNDTEYKCTAIQHKDSTGWKRTYVGNGNLVRSDIAATDYPFCVMNVDDDDIYSGYYASAEDENGTIGVAELNSTTKKIDSQYIPSEYVTEDELNAKGYLTEVPGGYATEEYVTNAINEAIGTALEGEY